MTKRRTCLCCGKTISHIMYDVDTGEHFYTKGELHAHTIRPNYCGQCGQALFEETRPRSTSIPDEVQEKITAYYEQRRLNTENALKKLKKLKRRKHARQI